MRCSRAILAAIFAGMVVVKGDHDGNDTHFDNETETTQPAATNNSNSVSTSSSVSDSSFCFSGDSSVQRQTQDGFEYVLLKDIELGDFVLSQNNDGMVEYSEVLHRLHYLSNDGSDELLSMRKICSINTCLTMTNDHLLYINGYKLDNLIAAGNAKIGDLIWNHRLNGLEAIVSIEENVVAYPRDVLTRNGNIIVDGILASTYIGKGKWDHIILETIMKSLYHLANDMPILYQYIADGPAIWKNEQITTVIHQIILFLYFNVYISIVNNLMTLFTMSLAIVVYRKWN